MELMSTLLNKWKISRVDLLVQLWNLEYMNLSNNVLLSKLSYEQFYQNSIFHIDVICSLHYLDSIDLRSAF